VYGYGWGSFSCLIVRELKSSINRHANGRFSWHRKAKLDGAPLFVCLEEVTSYSVRICGISDSCFPHAHTHALSFPLQLREKIVGAYEALKKAIFIIASFLIIFIALRNSLIW